MKLKFNRDYLDFKTGKTYDVNPDSTAKYIVSMSIAKEVVTKDGQPVPTAAELKAIADKEVADRLKAEQDEADRLKAEQDEAALKLKEVNEANIDNSPEVAAEKAKTEPAKKGNTKAESKAKAEPKAKEEIKSITNENDPDDLLGLFSN